MATKSIGTLKASLILDDRGFVGGFNKAKTTASTATSSITGTIGRFAATAGSSMLAIGTAAVASAASISTLKNSFDSIDRTAKLADRLDITYESMQKLSLAADLAGADSEKLAKSMLFMARTIGSGGKPLDQRFFEVADSIAKIEDPAVRAKEAMRIFGRDGLENLNLIIQGGKGIRDSAAAIDKFGLGISRVDAAKVEAANDAITVLSTVTKGFVDKFAVEFAPAVEGFADRMLRAYERIGEGTSKLGLRIDDLGGKLDKLLFENPVVSNLVLGVFGSALLGGKLPDKPAATVDSGRGVPDLFAEAAKRSATPKPAALERNSVEAVRAIQSAGGDGTSGIIVELKNILRTIQVIGEDARRESAAKDGFLIREGKL